MALACCLKQNSQNVFQEEVSSCLLRLHVPQIILKAYIALHLTSESNSVLYFARLQALKMATGAKLNF